jgi:hypothetical protein
MAHDVFISHSSKDKPIADAVCATLEAHGVRCWVSPRDILPGLDWSEAVIDAITESRVLVLVFSSNANASVQVKREVQCAFEKGLIVIPLRVEDVAPSKALEYYIGSVHWLDALTPPLERHMLHLVQTLKLLLSRPTADPHLQIGGPGSQETRPDEREGHPARRGNRTIQGLLRRHWPVLLVAASMGLLLTFGLAFDGQVHRLPDPTHTKMVVQHRPEHYEQEGDRFYRRGAFGEAAAAYIKAARQYKAHDQIPAQERCLKKAERAADDRYPPELRHELAPPLEANRYREGPASKGTASLAEP